MPLADWIKQAPRRVKHTVQRMRGETEERSLRVLRREMLASQWLSGQKLAEWQFARIKKLLHHAYRTTRYYRELLDGQGLRVEDIRSLDDYKRAVPVLEKSTIRERFDDLLSSEWRDRCYTGTTGGSTGTPVRYARPHPYPEHRAMWAMVRDLCGLTGNERTLQFVGRPMPEGGYHYFDEKANLHRFSFHQMPGHGIQEVLDLILEWRPEFIYGYCSPLTEVASLLEESGHTQLGVKAVQSHSEKLHRHQRELLGRVFGGHVYDHYGCSEINHLGVDCYTHTGIHLFENIRFYEIDPVGDQPDVGELIVTDLYNVAMPTLRYRLGDVLTLDRSVCSCGRSMPRAVVAGRSYDLVRLRDGSIIVEDQFTDMMEPAQVERYLIHQRSLDRLDIHIVPTAGFSQDFGDSLVRTIREKMRFPDVRLILDPTFDTQIAGKSRLVRSDVSAEMVRAAR